MSDAIQGAVATSFAIQDFIMMQEKEHLLLKQALEVEAQGMLSLIDTATGPQELAADGLIGTLLHVSV